MAISILLTLLFCLSFSKPALALKNPIAVYCDSLGYQYNTQDGSCQFGQSQSCPGFDFMSGQCGQEYSYCQQQGLKTITSTDPSLCHDSIPCTICQDDQGQVLGEAPRLMNLDYREGKCGDGVCVMGEDVQSCPQDCTASGNSVQKLSCKPCPSGIFTSPNANFNCQGSISFKDFSLWQQQYRQIKQGQNIPPEEMYADYNCDQQVDLSDFWFWLKIYLNIFKRISS